MSEKDVTFQYCDGIIDQFEKVCKHPIVEKSSVYYAGVDLGTACIVVAVLDENRRPVAGRYKYADVVRDGMVVDYFGAVQIIREMKAQLEEELGVEERSTQLPRSRPAPIRWTAGRSRTWCRAPGSR